MAPPTTPHRIVHPTPQQVPATLEDPKSKKYQIITLVPIVPAQPVKQYVATIIGAIFLCLAAYQVITHLDGGTLDIERHRTIAVVGQMLLYSAIGMVALRFARRYTAHEPDPEADPRDTPGAVFLPTLVQGDNQLITPANLQALLDDDEVAVTATRLAKRIAEAMPVRDLIRNRYVEDTSRNRDSSGLKDNPLFKDHPVFLTATYVQETRALEQLIHNHLGGAR